MGLNGGAGDPHYQRQVGDQTVVGSQHRGAQGVAAATPMTALQLGQVRTGQAAHTRGRGLDDAGVGALVGVESYGDSVRLVVVVAAIRNLIAGDGGQDDVRPKASAQEGYEAGPAARLDGDSRPSKTRGPEVGVRALDLGQLAVDGLDLFVLLRLGQRLVDGGAVDLALEIVLEAPAIGGGDLRVHGAQSSPFAAGFLGVQKRKWRSP